MPLVHHEGICDRPKRNYFIEAATCSSSRAINELGQDFLSCLENLLWHQHPRIQPVRG